MATPNTVTTAHITRMVAMNAEGISNRAIAAKLGISARSVKNHLVKALSGGDHLPLDYHQPTTLDDALREADAWLASPAASARRERHRGDLYDADHGTADDKVAYFDCTLEGLVDG